MTIRLPRYSIGDGSHGLVLERIGATGRTVQKVGSSSGWAPLRGPKKCRDRAGRWRRRHEYDADGICIFCDHDRGWEPL